MSSNLPSRSNRPHPPQQAEPPPPPPPVEAATPGSGRSVPARGPSGSGATQRAPSAQRQIPTQRDADRERVARPPRPRRPEPEPEPRTVPSSGHRLRQALNSPRALRQAVLLREVLGPPVSLRRPGDDFR